MEHRHRLLEMTVGVKFLSPSLLDFPLPALLPLPDMHSFSHLLSLYLFLLLLCPIPSCLFPSPFLLSPLRSPTP